MTDADPLETRVDRLESGQDRMTRKLDEILGKLTGRKAEPAMNGTESDPGTGRPESFAEQVRAEIARSKAEDQAKADADKAKAEGESMAERLAKLEEKKPQAPQPRRQRVMFGKP